MDEFIEEIWKKVVGAASDSLEWLKEVVFGEFEDNRSVSAVVADMLVSFVPGVIIVTSARDLTAVIIRMVRHPEKRDHVEEWMLIIGCAIPLVLPILAAAAGAAAVGVGAIVGGIGGSEAGAALRATCLMLIKEGTHILADLLAFLRRFVKGDVFAVLRDIKFARYGNALIEYIGKFIAKLARVVNKLHGELSRLPKFQRVVEVLEKLENLERDFYGVQSKALSQIPKALAELDARLARALTEEVVTGKRVAQTGIPAGKAVPIKPKPARVPAMPENGLGRPQGTVHPPEPARPVEEKPNLHPDEPHLKKMPETEVPCFKPIGKSGRPMTAADMAEMDRQLAGQQAGLNKMTAQEYLDGRAAFDPANRDSAAAQAARARYQGELEDAARARYRAQGLSLADAQSQAAADAAQEMRSLAALHNPDMVAGGADVISDFGSRRINSKIGAAWSGSRVNSMDAAASAIPAGERATTAMNVRLRRCP